MGPLRLEKGLGQGMSSMTDSRLAFVDTNILIYAFDRRNSPKKMIASDLLDSLAKEGRLRISTQVLQEFYNAATRKVATPIPTNEALFIVDTLTAWPVFQVDVQSIRQAILLVQNASISFWDALIVVSASRIGADLLFTEDLNHGERILGVEVVNPFR